MNKSVPYVVGDAEEWLGENLRLQRLSIVTRENSNIYSVPKENFGNEVAWVLTQSRSVVTREKPHPIRLLKERGL